MFKKILKILVIIASIAAFAAGIIYVINTRKNKDTITNEEEIDAKPEEEHLDAADALDLSSLKFSRHYVDLR